ncbi:protein ESSENTIAL FOR POTEXVIRUS ACCUMULATION 1-like isoform X2 [Macadamia integrifolia]|uniref:protein ESSENTIAL FOR POTEXVIRUS ACCUMULATION 1-like isoform X2 n=1 Tax=Macadamia integrifolia TaxID=60698 RepID=UPI001C4F227A|nr:protein ESSENTIAL FOR POTEXVIRUS ACCUMULATION 1-like isoform X2 [Macadamia integrifolia]
MAAKNNADARHHLSVNTSPRITKEMQGLDNLIPLSPQWLLPKPGDSKPGMVTGESNFSPSPGHNSSVDASKSSGNGEEIQDNEKKRDVYRLSLLDTESGRRDRWRDEERDTDSSIRRDRWREGDKEIGDARKVDKWMDSPSIRHSGEARRAPSERWTDSGNRESNYEQRRESKWNTRWGPEDKESESWREKWLDSSRDGEVPRDKGLSHLNNHGKDDKEGDHYRPWRSNSSQNRGRGEPHFQTLTPNKQTPMHGYSRGRGENTPPTFSVGRGRVGSGGSAVNSTSAYPLSLGSVSDKIESAHGDSFPLSYSRTKLLDIYRVTDVGSFGKQLDGFVEVPSLTQADPLEPLALSAPTVEELVVLKGIDRGDIVSSSIPQVSKDGTVGRNSTDLVQTRRTRLGSREDLPSSIDDFKEDSDNSKAFREDFSATKKVNEVAVGREMSAHGNSSPHPGIPWRSQSLGERSHLPSHDWRDFSAEVRSATSEMGWSHSQKEQDAERENSKTVLPSYCKDDSNWQVGEGFLSDIGSDSVLRRQSSEVFDRERETRKFLLQTSPEELSLCYKDPQGEIQGPFSGSDLIGWFEAGYFSIDLQVRISSASPDTPFSLLGDVMPHLRAKARPPPGFSTSKPNETADTLSRPKFSSLGKLHAGSSEIDIMKNESRGKHESGTDAENRFLESLMSSNMSSPPRDKFGFPEGLQGFIGNNSGGMPPVGAESGNDLNYLLAQRISLERQRSLPNPHPYWPGRDAASMVPKAELVPDPSSHSKLLSSMVDGHLQIPHIQNKDFMSVLQGGASDNSSSSVNGISSWSNFPVQSGLDARQDKIDMHHNQPYSGQTAYVMQQQRMQQQNQPSLSPLIPQNIDHPTGIVTPEKLLTSGLSQDPQMLSILQQQYLLSQLQLHPQAPVPAQLSLLDKLILLKQQQKQEQQQQLLRQQHLLSQVLSEHQSHNHFPEPSYGHLPAAAVAAGNASVDLRGLCPPHDMFQNNSQMPVPNLQDGHVANFATLSSQLPQDIAYSTSSEASLLHLPHQIFGNVTHPKGWGGTIPEKIDDIQQKMPTVVDNSPSLEVMDNSSFETPTLQEHVLTSDRSAAVVQAQLSESTPTSSEPAVVCTPEAISISVPLASPEIPSSAPSGADKAETSVHEQTNDVKPPSASVEEPQGQHVQCKIESLMVKEVKNTEVREAKKASEKKSRKQKSSKMQSSADQSKGISKTSTPLPMKQSETVGVEAKSEMHMDVGEAIYGTSPVTTGDAGTGVSTVETLASQLAKSSLAGSFSNNEVSSIEGRFEPREVESITAHSTQGHSGQKAWKSGPGLKAKSLLEIQLEEQRKAQMEMIISENAISVNSMSSSTPWAGVVANAEPKMVRDNHQDAVGAQTTIGKADSSVNPVSKKSQLHDLLAEEVLAKSNSNERTSEVSDNVSNLPVSIQADPIVDNDDFIEAKDTKKSRKKSAKGKGMAAKASTPIASADMPIASSPVEKAKSSRQVQQEKDVLPAPPSGPSLGDFVIWKGESASPLPAPAWSTDSGKLNKPTSLRDILKEQEKKFSSVQNQNQMPTPQKVQSTRNTRGSGSSWTVSGSSPSKAASPIQINSLASVHSKSKAEDDLFWGPLDQSKQEAKQSDFPSLAKQSSWGSKVTAVKGTVAGSASRQKSTGSRTADYSVSSSAVSQSSLRGKRDTISKQSEAMDFRYWCESESVRLTGTKDTSFLEFCLKQSTSEAETLLIENLGSFDPDHEFIDKFLNYKELLSADVIEIAFRSQNDRRVDGFGVADVNAESAGAGDFDSDMAADGSTKGGGKKKGKKGKKVSSSVLGFNVVSNRIMMGEIQTLED